MKRYRSTHGVRMSDEETLSETPILSYENEGRVVTYTNRKTHGCGFRGFTMRSEVCCWLECTKMKFRSEGEENKRK